MAPAITTGPIRSNWIIMVVGFVPALSVFAASAQSERPFATGVDSTGWAQAVSNAEGQVLIESPEYPRGLWVRLTDEAGVSLDGIEVEYQGAPDSLVAVRCVDPTGLLQEALIWNRPQADGLQATLRPSEAVDLPEGFTPINWKVDPTAEHLLKWKIEDGFFREILEDEIPPEFEVEAATGLGLLKDWVVIRPPDILRIRSLYLANNQLADIGPLALLTELERLDLTNNQLVDATPLAQLENLELLYLSGNRIADVGPLGQLTNLEFLYLGGNQLADIRSLVQLKNLKKIHLGYNQITDLTPLSSLTKIESFRLNHNQIRDIAPLVANPGLAEGDFLNLEHNPLGDRALNEQIPALQARGVIVDY
ncbi:MAG: hypothetical protein GKR89_03240 [Candidatus Latescibacteria bacterium]|nr:hypothetical protein [Candidatus Latescibacterota bacterium]